MKLPMLVEDTAFEMSSLTFINADNGVMVAPAIVQWKSGVTTTALCVVAPDDVQYIVETVDAPLLLVEFGFSREEAVKLVRAVVLAVSAALSAHPEFMPECKTIQ